VFVVFSANYFVPFMPEPKAMPAGALSFVMAFMASGLMTVIKIVEMAAGLALLANRAVPLAITLLAPIVVGITGFHAMLAPEGLPIAIGLVALEVVLAWSYRAAFKPMLALRAAPGNSAPIAGVLESPTP
jgi:hypothetical protein